MDIIEDFYLIRKQFTLMMAAFSPLSLTVLKYKMIVVDLMSLESGIIMFSRSLQTMKPDCVRAYNISYKNVFFRLCLCFFPYILFIEIRRRLTLLSFKTDTFFPSVHKLKAERNHQIYFLFFIDNVNFQCVMNFMTAEYLKI